MLSYYRPAQHSNNQSLTVGVVRVTFMTPSYHRGTQIWSLSQVSFLSESSISKGILKHLAIIISAANGLRVDVSQYHLSSHGKLEKVDEVIYKFIGFSFSLFNINTHISHIHSSMHFFCSQRTLLFIYLIIASPCSHYFTYIATVTSPHVLN